jgi:hypothetical protein
MPHFENVARSLIGIPFRLHGRDPRIGLDCVGVVAEVLRGLGRDPVVPEGYSLRNTCVSRFLGFAVANDLIPTHAEGKIVLCMVNPIQPHLMVRVCGGFVHAHASLGCVTFMPDPLPWPIILQWNPAAAAQPHERDRKSSWQH